MFDKNAKILVADDQLMARNVLLKSLENSGFTNIVQAEDGRAAHQILQKSLNDGAPVQLVFTDIHMPELDGMELLRLCKADEQLGKTPFVIVTAEAEIHLVTEALMLGALDYIRKPVTVASLQKKIAVLNERLGKA